MIPDLTNEAEIFTDANLNFDFGQMRIPIQPVKCDHVSIDLPMSVTRRNLSRTGIFLNHIVSESKNIVERYISNDRFSLGIYGAIESGAPDLSVALKLASEEDDQFFKICRSELNPKSYFWTMPNMPVAQIAIMLNSYGRATTYTHSHLGGQMALRQAMYDLDSSAVSVALVCGAFSFENPFVVLRNHLREKRKIICEAAAAMLIIKDHDGVALTPKDLDNNTFGNIDNLVGILMER